MIRVTLLSLAMITGSHAEQGSNPTLGRPSPECVNYLKNFVQGIGAVNPFAERAHDYEKPVNGDLHANEDHAATLIRKHCPGS